MAERSLLPLRTTTLASTVEYDPPNQTVTAEAGMPLAALQQALQQNRQWLPVRPFLGAGTTLGGMAALGACGPERLRYGAPRDLVLGLRFVSGEGRLISTGGKVVKNVAGYDLGRLLIGSAGTLGFVTQLTLRVSSLPEACLAVRGCGPFDRIASAAAEVLRGRLEPALVAASPLNRATPWTGKERDETAWRLTVGLEGFAETVEAQGERCAALLAGCGLEGEGSVAYSALDGIFADNERALHGSPFLLRADLPLDMVAEFVKVPAGASQAQDLFVQDLFVDDLFVDFGCGRVRAGLSGLSGEAWEALCSRARALDGHILLEKSPDDFRRYRDVYGPPVPAWTVMHRIKDALDPNNIFAPGRMPGRK